MIGAAADWNAGMLVPGTFPIPKVSVVKNKKVLSKSRFYSGLLSIGKLP